MLLARAVSYQAFAQHASAVLSPLPSAPSLFMCICSGENKNRDKNAAQKLIRYLAWLKEATWAGGKARAAKCHPTGRASPARTTDPGNGSYQGSF